MSYFRHQYQSFEEFVREGLFDGEILGKEELELLEEIEADDEFDRPRARVRDRWE
jgi:hypothetical protein